MEACWWIGIFSLWFRNSFVKRHFNRSFRQPLFKTLSYSCQRHKCPATFSCCIFCSWEMSSTYNTGKIINASHSLCVDPCMLNKTVYKITRWGIFTPLSLGPGSEGTLLPECVSVAWQRLHSKHSLLSTRWWCVLHSPMTAVFKENLNGICIMPQEVETV